MIKNMIQLTLIGLFIGVLLIQLVLLIKELIKSKIEYNKICLDSALYRIDNNYSLDRKQKKVYKKYLNKINNKNKGWDE